jgi:hypothetical protein
MVTSTASRHWSSELLLHGSAGYMLRTVLAAGIVTHIGLDRNSRLRWAVWPWSRR